ncbi:MAG: thioredoxin family protein [Bacteroidales bacterium]
MEINDIQNLIASKTAILLYFYNDACAPCKVLRPKVQEMVDTDFPHLEFLLINTEIHSGTAAHYGVFASPTLLIFFEGKEYIRESKNISISELHDKIERIYRMVF